MKKRTKLIFKPGDVVKFHGHKRIVLGTVRTGDDQLLYQVFSPERGVYSAGDWEMEYIDHLNEFDQMTSKLSEMSLEASA